MDEQQHAGRLSVQLWRSQLQCEKVEQRCVTSKAKAKRSWDTLACVKNTDQAVTARSGCCAVLPWLCSTVLYCPGCTVRREVLKWIKLRNGWPLSQEVSKQSTGGVRSAYGVRRTRVHARSRCGSTVCKQAPLTSRCEHAYAATLSKPGWTGLYVYKGKQT